MLETALAFLVFAGLLIGAVDFGQFLFVHQALVERARSASRWGAVTDPTNTTAIKNKIIYGNAVVEADTNSLTGYFGLTPSNVDVWVSGVGTDHHRLNVKLSGYRFTILSPYITGTPIGRDINVLVPLGTTN